MFETDNLGAFCNSGAWQDLNHYIDADKFDMNQFPKTIRDYTAYKDKRCALPFLADSYGLYYNKKMLADAGIAAPAQDRRRAGRGREEAHGPQPGRLAQGRRLRPADGLVRERARPLGPDVGRDAG